MMGLIGHRLFIGLQLATSLLLTISQANSALAQTDQVKEKNTTLRLVVGAAAGGNIDLSARLVARNMPTYLGYNWNIVISNMPGAGSLNAANFVLKNNSEHEPMMAAITAPAVISHLTSQTSTGVFDAAAYDWLGSTLAGEAYCLTLRDKQKPEADSGKLILGATSSGSPSSTFAYLIKHLVGPGIKITHGYQGPQDLLAAVERSEIDAFCSFTLGNIEDLWPDRLASGKIRLLYSFPMPNESPNPLESKNIMDLARPEDINAINLFLSQQIFVQPYGVPASLPAPMRKILRDAFEKTVESDDFRKGFFRQNAPVKTANSSEVTKAIARIMNAPQREQEKIRQMIAQ